MVPFAVQYECRIPRYLDTILADHLGLAANDFVGEVDQSTCNKAPIPRMPNLRHTGPTAGRKRGTQVRDGPRRVRLVCDESGHFGELVGNAPDWMEIGLQVAAGPTSSAGLYGHSSILSDKDCPSRVQIIRHSTTSGAVGRLAWRRAWRRTARRSGVCTSAWRAHDSGHRCRSAWRRCCSQWDRLACSAESATSWSQPRQARSCLQGWTIWQGLSGPTEDFERRLPIGRGRMFPPLRNPAGGTCTIRE